MSSLKDLGASSGGDRFVLYSLFCIFFPFWAIVEAHNLAEFIKDRLLPALILRNYSKVSKTP